MRFSFCEMSQKISMMPDFYFLSSYYILYKKVIVHYFKNIYAKISCIVQVHYRPKVNFWTKLFPTIHFQFTIYFKNLEPIYSYK